MLYNKNTLYFVKISCNQNLKPLFKGLENNVAKYYVATKLEDQFLIISNGIVSYDKIYKRNQQLVVSKSVPFSSFIKDEKELYSFDELMEIEKFVEKKQIESYVPRDIHGFRVDKER